MNCFCDSPILPLIILFSCCNEDGSGGILGFGGSRSGLDQLLWLLCILCLCGGSSFTSESCSSDRRR